MATPGDDVTIFSTIIADTIDGLAGNDQIQGDRGDDLLNGGSGNDLIFGEEGNDTFNGGVSDDILIGGEGIDTFFFAANNGADRIEDFEIASDAIALVAKRRSPGGRPEFWLALQLWQPLVVGSSVCRC
ncbi:MAG: hypothetical protein EBE86_019185 [Hormoscilla sp. GUM202]|nr:hypothetical protein [Hormoscilla sp. GUM202]